MKLLTKAEVKLDECIDTLKGFAFKSQWYTNKGIPLIRVSDFSEDSISLDSITFIPENIAKDFDKYRIKKDDIIIQTVGSWPRNPKSVVGKAIRVPKNCNNALLNQNAVKIIPRNNIDHNFLFYLLRSKLFKDYIINTAQGAANQASITLESIKNFKFILPDLTSQKKIGFQIRQYDNLLENNEKRIKLLEQMAKLIYEEWFVNFKFSGYGKVKMIDSKTEFGKIPEGWKIDELSTIIKIQRGCSYRGNELSEDKGVSFINLKTILPGGNGGFRRSGLKRYTGKFKDSQRLFVGDIVMAITEVTQKREIIARPARIPQLNEENITFSMDLVKIVPEEDTNKDWLYGFLKYSSFGMKVKEFANGVNVLHLNPSKILDYKLVIPSEEIIKKFSCIVSSIFQIIDNFELKNQNLRQTRDFLLPKLISGEVDVSKLDIKLSEVEK